MSFLNLMSAARTSLSLASLVVLTACGGGGGDSEPTPVNTADLNPSLTPLTTPAALPNATKLIPATVANPSGSDFTTTVGSATYQYTLSGSDGFTPTGQTAADYTYVNAGFVMLCKNGTPETVFAAPYLDSATPAKPEALYGKNFVEVTSCPATQSDPTPTGREVEFKNDGSATITNGSDTDDLSKADLNKYFSDLGSQQDSNVFRGHIYKITNTGSGGLQEGYIIIETRKEGGVDRVSMLVEEF